MWQQLDETLKDRNFMVVAVAQDSRADAARPWIEQAKPTCWSLVDSGHRVSSLYGMVNVPRAVPVQRGSLPISQRRYSSMNRFTPASLLEFLVLTSAIAFREHEKDYRQFPHGYEAPSERGNRRTGYPKAG